MALGELNSSPKQVKYHRPARKPLVLDDIKCHRDKAFVVDLRKRADTTVIHIPDGLTPLLQPLDRMLNKQMKRLMLGYIASAVADPKDEAAGAWGRVHILEAIMGRKLL